MPECVIMPNGLFYPANCTLLPSPFHGINAKILQKCEFAAFTRAKFTYIMYLWICVNLLIYMQFAHVQKDTLCV